MVAQPYPQPRPPAPITNLAQARHLKRQRQRLAALVGALIATREARFATHQALVAAAIEPLQARAEREMAARRLFWSQFPPLSQ